MRLWLKDSERRPDPIPAATDDRVPVLVGTGLWSIAAVILLIGIVPLVSGGSLWWLWTCLAGIGIGIIGIIYTRARRN